MFNYLAYGALALCGVVAIPRITNHSLLYGMLYVDYSLNTLKDPYEFPPATRIQYANNYFKGLYYGFGQQYNVPLNYFDLTVPAKPDSDTAILLIHGLGRNVGDWNWLRKQFESTNSWVYMVDLQPQSAGINEIAGESIVPKIAAIKRQSGCKNIILIGASMGGLVASYYKEFLDHDNDIKGVITLGSPLHGTKVAVAKAGTGSRQMCPDSKFLEDLRTSMNKHPQYYYQVASKFDEVMFPWDSALLENSSKSQQFILHFEGHLGLLHNSDVAAQLNKWVVQIQESSRIQTNHLNQTLLFRRTHQHSSLHKNMEYNAENGEMLKFRK